MADLSHYILIEAPAARVYEAVATAQGMRGWWTADTQMEEHVGGRALCGFNHRAAVFRMTIDALETNKRVLMSCSGDNPEWAGSRLEWSVTDQGDTTALAFTHHN